MRKLTKGKSRKSESLSDAESEANGDSVHTNEDAVDQTMMPNNDGESAPKSKRRVSKGRDKSINNDSEKAKNDEDETESTESSKQENGNTSKSGDKRRKKDTRQATTSQDENSDQEYEVEKLIAERTIKGRRQFLVRWKGYSIDDDTWEFEKDLNCSKLIADFLKEKLNQDDKTKNPADRPKGKRGRKPKVKKPINDEKEASENEGERETKRVRKSKEAKKDHEAEDDDEDEEREFEVEKIIDVHFKKNKRRDFLIRWKGFSSANDTWEPEENLNCPELIAKFMDKVDKAKISGVRELRTNPSHTKRYTLTMHNKERRLSRRNLGKERATYHQCDE